jgi:1-phosphofructokinase family hexose kinase
MQQGSHELTLPAHAVDLVPVFTVTLNPVVDLTYHVPHFLAGKTYVAERSEAYAGGKGANVSRALKHLGIVSTATGLIGQQGKRSYLDILDSEGLEHSFMTVEGALRSNVTIITPGKHETHIRDKGPELTADALYRFKTFLSKHVAGAADKNHNTGCSKTIVILSGSMPPGLPADSYGMLLRDAKEMGALTLLDASGDALKYALAARPYFIKPNRHEAEDVLGFLPESEDDYKKAIDLLHAQGIERVMLSRGKQGLYLSDGNSIISASVHVNGAINSVGSGDAAVAGAVFAMVQRLDTEHTARLCCALGAANTLVPGACRLRMPNLQDLYREVLVEKL